MSNDKTSEREELEKAIEQLKDIQKGNTSTEVIDAIIDKIQENDIEDQGNDKAARPSNSSDETQPNV